SLAAAARALLRPAGSSDTTTARPLNIAQNRSLPTAVPTLPLMPVPPLADRVRQRLQQSGAAEYQPYLSEQAARPLIHGRHVPSSDGPAHRAVGSHDWLVAWARQCRGPGAGGQMQAIMVSEPGGPEVLRVGETDIPRPGRGEVLVRVLAAGVGPWDASLRRGGWSGPWPYIPGAEFAGLVEGH